jgi:hypothetical protein
MPLKPQPSLLVKTQQELSKSSELDGTMKTTTSWIKATLPSITARVVLLVSSPALLALYLLTAASWILLCFTILVIVLLPALALNLALRLAQRIHLALYQHLIR